MKKPVRRSRSRRHRARDRKTFSMKKPLLFAVTTVLAIACIAAVVGGNSNTSGEPAGQEPATVITQQTLQDASWNFGLRGCGPSGCGPRGCGPSGCPPR